jgi:competence protein ComEC
MKKIFHSFFILVSLLLVGCYIDLTYFLHHDQFQITFLDVGQGDSTLIRTPQNCTMLIDGGPPINLTQKIKDHLPILEKSIDLVVLTHPHLDHMAGLLELQHRYNFQNLWITGVNYSTSEYAEFLLAANLHPTTQIKYITKPAKYNLCGAQITILSPLYSFLAQDNPNINNTSIILLIELKDQKILLTGDAEHEQEQELLSHYQNTLPNLTILKAGHHGSRTSTSIELLNATNPDYLIISAGDGNRYGHPHFETIQKADQLGIQILRTDRHSDITFFF